MLPSFLKSLNCSIFISNKTSSALFEKDQRYYKYPRLKICYPYSKNMEDGCPPITDESTERISDSDPTIKCYCHAATQRDFKSKEESFFVPKLCYSGSEESDSELNEIESDQSKRVDVKIEPDSEPVPSTVDDNEKSADSCVVDCSLEKECSDLLSDQLKQDSSTIVDIKIESDSEPVPSTINDDGKTPDSCAVACSVKKEDDDQLSKDENQTPHIQVRLKLIDFFLIWSLQDN